MQTTPSHSSHAHQQCRSPTVPITPPKHRAHRPLHEGDIAQLSITPDPSPGLLGPIAHADHSCDADPASPSASFQRHHHACSHIHKQNTRLTPRHTSPPTRHPQPLSYPLCQFKLETLGALLHRAAPHRAPCMATSPIPAVTPADYIWPQQALNPQLDNTAVRRHAAYPPISVGRSGPTSYNKPIFSRGDLHNH